MEEMNTEMTENVAPMSEDAASKPLVETSVTVDGALQARLGKKLRVCGLLGVIVGTVLLLAYIVCSTVFEMLAEEGRFSVEPWFNTLLQVALWGGAVLFVIGLVVFLGARASVKNMKTAYRNVYRFYRGYVFIETERQGEAVSTLKLYYADLMTVRETKELFLLYNTATSCFAVDKRKLTPEEIAELRKVLPLKK